MREAVESLQNPPANRTSAPNPTHTYVRGATKIWTDERRPVPKDRTPLNAREGGTGYFPFALNPSTACPAV